MQLHERDLAMARAIDERSKDFPALTEEQQKLIREYARGCLAWVTRHRSLHNAISATLLIGLVGGDLLALLVLPGLLPFGPHGLFAGTIAGLVHGFLICSTVTYSVHEGAAHDRIILGATPRHRLLRYLANNACRLFFAVPDYYRDSHAAHHRHLGTELDGSFTHAVDPWRLLTSLLPAAPVLSHSDFFPWRPQEHTESRRRSMAVSTIYMVLTTILAASRFGIVCAVVTVFIVGGVVGVLLDRLREATEHVRMPLDTRNGTRQLGLGIWGLVLGGGPWGQPCHLSHHLEPALVWYHQIGLHFLLRRILTREQKRRFFLEPLTGWPSLLFGIVRDHVAFGAQRRGQT